MSKVKTLVKTSDTMMSMNPLWGQREAFGKLWGETEQL